MKRMWRIWAKALGEKSGANNKEADKIALVRTILILQAVATNVFIVWGVIDRLKGCN